MASATAAPPARRADDPQAQAGRTTGIPVLVAVVSAVAALVSLAVQVGGDARWMVALTRAPSVPARPVPYAAADSSGWADVPALGAHLLSAAYAVAGERGLLVLQLACVLVGLASLAAVAARHGVGAGRTAAALLLLVVGAAPAFAVARGQMFTLALLPALLLLLDVAGRDRRLVLLLPLLAVWSNLHGGVLVGTAVAGAYVVLELRRERPLFAAALLSAVPVAVCLTPALWRTPAYFLGVLGNEAARRHLGLWRSLSVSSPFDVAVILVAVAYAVLTFRLGRRPPWQVAVLGLLAVMTWRADRNGPWLLEVGAFVLLACGPQLPTWRRGLPTSVATLATVAALGIMVVTVAERPAVAPHRQLVAEAVRLSDGRPLLAEDVLGEEVAVAGGRVWLTNPVDAFSSADQRTFFDWETGSPSGDRALQEAPGGVLTGRGSAADRRMAANAHYRLVRSDATAAFYQAS